jgi:hypothetical protein
VPGPIGSLRTSSKRLKERQSGLLRVGNQAFTRYQGKVPDEGNCDGGYDLLNSFYMDFRRGR